MKSTSLTRGFALAKLAAQVGLKELKSGDFNSRLEQARLITKSLANLKGAAMKAGQLMSLELDHYFPPEAIEILSQLQNAAVAHPFSEIEEIITKNLGQKKRSSLDYIDPKPLGVASIGQVHKARYKDREIVLKVQYPGVAESVGADVKVLKTVATSFCQLTGRKMDLQPLFNEMKTLFEQELDYQNEAHYQTLFRKHIKELQQTNSCSFYVPEIIPELSNSSVLAMEFAEGLTLRQWINTRPGIEQRQTLAKAILDLYFHEFFHWGLVQTDPNWGNFLISEKGSELLLTLLDFGATRKYERKFIQDYIKLLEFASENQSQSLKKLTLEMGWIDARESETAFTALEIMLKTSIKPFFTAQNGSTLFDFSDAKHGLDSRTTAKALTRELKYSPPPYLIIFLHRKLAGVYSILKNLEVKMDLSPYWQMMSDLAKQES